MALTATMLAKPGWKQGEQGHILAKSSIALMILYFLVNTSDLFVPPNPNATQPQALVKPINLGMHVALVVAAVVTVGQIVWQIAKIAG